jgi:hypothetical protein
MWHKSLLRVAAVLTACVLAGGSTAASAASAGSSPPGTTPAGGLPTPPALLWPRFSEPQTLYVANAEHMPGVNLLTATTLQGLYNAGQKTSRLFLIQSSQDEFWLKQLPASIHQVTVTPPPGQILLTTLLKQFGAGIKHAVEVDPANPDTINLATTMASIDHAIVIHPAQVSGVKALGITVPTALNLDNQQFTRWKGNPAQTYQWGVKYLLPRTSTKLLVMLNSNNNGNLRDYAVATGAFTFWLTSIDPADKPVMKTIISHTPANTPIMGYIPNETADVAYLSSLGHFLNASDLLDNESVWAAMPVPAKALRESTQPAPIAARPGTVYVAFVTSDGDNAQYMQHQMADLWAGPDLGAVPAGWTVSPGTAYFYPTMLEYFNSHLPADSELDAGPSGIGYASQTNSSALGQFAKISGQIMAFDGLHSTNSYEPSAAQAQYAKAATPAIASISQKDPLLEEQLGGTVLFGKTSSYMNAPQAVFCTVHQQSLEQHGTPVFLEPLVNAWTITPADMLHMAQQLAVAAKADGLSFVFTTPAELALTMQRYYSGKEAGLPAANVQSMTGAQVLAEPSAGPSFPTGTVKVTGANVVTNPSGAAGTTGWSTSGGSVTAARYQGHPALHYTSTVTGNDSYVRYLPRVTDGKTYTFSVNLAGSGQVYMTVYDGAEYEPTIPVRLTSSYQHLTWTVTIPGSPKGAPQLQVGESGAAPVSVYISGASVASSTAAC